MTTTQYYYHEPLAALWMAKHFGMRFYNGYDIECGNFIMDGTTIFYQNGCGAIGQRLAWEKDYEGYFYIHPDSIHLLTPQMNDIILCADRYDLVKLVQCPSIVDYLHQIPPHILKRDLTIFHWPHETATHPEQEYVFIKNIIIDGRTFETWYEALRLLERRSWEDFFLTDKPLRLSQSIEIISAKLEDIPDEEPLAKFTKEQWSIINEAAPGYGVKCTQL